MISGDFPFVIHGSPVKGLSRIEPFVPEIRKSAQTVASDIDMSALVYTLDPFHGIQEGFNMEKQARFMLGYTKPKGENGFIMREAPSSGSVYIGRVDPEKSWLESEKMNRPKLDFSTPDKPSIKLVPPPVRVSTEGFDVLHEISVDGKTEQELADEINRTLENLKNQNTKPNLLDQISKPVGKIDPGTAAAARAAAEVKSPALNGSILDAAISAQKAEARISASSSERLLPRTVESAASAIRRSSRNKKSSFRSFSCGYNGKKGFRSSKTSWRSYVYS